MRNNTTYLLAFFLFLSALMNGGSAPPQHEPSHVAAVAPPDAKNFGAEPFLYHNCYIPRDADYLELCKSCPDFCPYRSLKDVIDGEFPAPAKTPVPASSTAAASKSPAPSKNPPADLRFVIATLADPVHTHMSLVFDRSIDATQKSAESNGYLFSKSWMPWQADSQPASADYRLRQEQDLLQDKREELPGLLAFRGCATSPGSPSAPCTPNHLFVFVVGETPTAGIRRDQFANALRLMRDIENRFGASRPKLPLRILGTSFSGSLASLSKAIRKSDLSKLESILVASGQTTDVQSISGFQQELKSIGASSTQHIPNRFVSMVENDDYAEAHLRCFLFRQGYSSRSIAILSEDETAYGSTGPEGGASAPLLSCGNGLFESRQPSHFYFPRDISQLRAAYQRQILGGEVADTTKRPPRQSLSLNLDVTGSDDDSVPTFARLQSPISQQGVLKGIVSDLKRHHALFVIIRASNPLDTVFLCQYLRETYPQGQLFTLNADLLFQQDPDSTKLLGTFSVGSYPMIPGIEDYVSSARTRHVDQIFPDALANGTYNAMSLLLSNSKAPALFESDASPLPQGEYSSYRAPRVSDLQIPLAHPGRPALWLTAVGRGGFWPVSVLDESPVLLGGKAVGSSLAPAPQPDILPPHLHFGIAWKILWWFSLLFSLTYSYFMLRRDRPAHYPRSEFEISFNFQPNPLICGFLALLGALLIAFQMLFLFPFLRSDYLKPEEFWLLLFPLVTVGLLYFAVVSGLIRRQMEPWPYVYACVGIPVLVVAEYFLGIWVQYQGSATDFFLIRRFTHLESGLAPSLPLFISLIAFAWAAWFALDGLHLTRRELRHLPSGVELRTALGPFLQPREPGTTPSIETTLSCIAVMRVSEDEHRDLFEAMDPFSSLLTIYVPAILVLIGFLFLCAFEVPLTLLEGDPYRKLLMCILTPGLLLLTLLCTRILKIWLEFKHFLSTLDSLRFSRAFRGFQEWGSLWQISSNAGTMGIYHLVREFIEAFTSVAAHFPAEKAIQKSNALLAEKLCSLAPLPEPIPDDPKSDLPRKPAPRHAPFDHLKTINQLIDLHDSLAKAASALLAFLVRKWTTIEEPAPAPSKFLHLGFRASIALDARSLPDKPPSRSGKPNEKAKDHEDTSAPLDDDDVSGADRALCLYFFCTIVIVLRRIQSIAFAIAGIYVFFVLALTSYPLEPHLTIQTVLIALFLLILCVLGYVYAQIHRNTLLSRITSTTDAALGWDFYLKMAGILVVPVLTLLASQFPQINQVLFSWIEPALQSVH